LSCWTCVSRIMKQYNDKPFPHKSQQRLITFCRATTWWSASSWKPLIPCSQKKAMKHASVTFRDKLRVILYN
jgi:hypothetical protein